jgi:hypothetical protein
VRKIFRREMAAAMCYGRGKEPSLPSFKGDREVTVSEESPLMRRFEKRPLLHLLRMISTPLRFANYKGATCPRPLHLHMVL